MKLTITINMDNAAFEDGGSEVANILHGYSQKIQNGHTLERNLMDSNGNSVGKAIVTGKRPA